MDASEVGPSLIKQLASCDNKHRNRCVRILIKTWLPSQLKISDDLMKKLWKGLFYCVWHADKLPAQTHLINTLSSPLPDLSLSVSIPYLSVFFLTMRREWTGIDRLRLDKFYLLIRRFLYSFFLVLKRNSWDLELCSRMMGVLQDFTLLANDNFQGNGVNYHIASIFLEELRPFLPLSKQVLEVVFGCLVSVMGKVPDKVLLGKIKSNVFDVLSKMGEKLLEVKKSGEDIDSGDDVMVLGSVGLALGFSTKFYELGSSEECCQGNRKMIFCLHEEFLMLEKDLALSSVEILIPEVLVDCDNDDNEVPTLVSIADGMEMDASDISAANGNGKKDSKRHKKVKKGSSGSGKKAKKSKNTISGCSTEVGVMGEENGGAILPCSAHSSEKESSDVNLISFDESVISNLQMQFEKVAAEVGLDKGPENVCIFPEVNIVSRKRKRAKSMDRQQTENPELTSQTDAEGGATLKSGEKSQKKVRFSMKNNLVWKPHSPLPPQSLRLPPSVTPRGSALKKGIPPGPIKEMPPATKRAKQGAKSLKNRRKGRKNTTSSIKRLKKLKSLST